MGAKDSKPASCITYEEAVKRLPEGEFKGMKEAFKRLSNLNGLVSKQSFVKDVLGDEVPVPVAEYIYLACGGSSKGIAFKEMLCVLVLLARGTQQERIRFLFELYTFETDTHLVREEFQKHLQICESGYIPDSIGALFNESGKDRVTFEEFRDWLREYPDATSLSRWLLCELSTVTFGNELETPTFYQTLAGVTHLEERDILELEKMYWVLKGESRTGKLDLETLSPLISPPIPLSVCTGLFAAFDENRDNHIDFKEMACGVSAAARGPIMERQKFCFKVFDVDRDGFLSEDEMNQIVSVMAYIRLENNPSEEEGLAKEKLECLADMKRRASPNGLAIEDYLMWSMENVLSHDFLRLLFQVCHIVLGLRPISSLEEGEIVRGWLDREERRGFRVGQFWYLIAMEWWNSWLEYIGQPKIYISASERSASPIKMSDSHASGSLKRAAQKITGGSSKRSIIENTLALVGSNTVVITGMTSLEIHEPHSVPSPSTSTSNLSVGNSDISASLVTKSTSRVKGTRSMPRNPWSDTGTSGSDDDSQTLRPSKDAQAELLLPYFNVPPSPSQSPIPPPRVPTRPGLIDNSSLVAPPMFKVKSLTDEGGKLKKHVPLARTIHFELVPAALWRALAHWYGVTLELPRLVIAHERTSDPELEMYPITVKLFRHQNLPAKIPQPPTTWPLSYGAAVISYAYATNTPTTPKRYLAYLATFSRRASIAQVYVFLSDKLRYRLEDLRLWHIRDENNMVILEDETITLQDLGVNDDEEFLIEIRNKDLTWPEEMGSLVIPSNDTVKQVEATEKGATGLNNLGNTCFMNSALQCVSNTKILTTYFLNNYHLYEINRTNPLGMQGHMAQCYGDLLHELWSGSSKAIAPIKLRWTIGRYAPQFKGTEQHDAQELLAFLLDGLHEDLNRVHDKQYKELNDSDGRSDVIVAQEAWDNHILRNKSIIVDLFYGQLKSKVRCQVCGHESVTFDVFNMLSLPIPMESHIHILVLVIKLDGSVPIKYGMRLNMDDTYSNLKQQLSSLCNIPPVYIKLAELSGAQIKTLLKDEHKVKMPQNGELLYGYELPAFPSGGSLCGDEEQLSVSNLKSQEAQTFQAIPRSVQPHFTPGVSRGSASLGNQSEENTDTTTSPTDTEGSMPVVDTLAIEATENLQTVADSGNCSASSLSLAIDTNFGHQLGFVVAFHRKLIQQEVNLVSSQKSKPSVFGLPVIVPCSDNTTHQDLYQSVWLQVARLVSPLPPSETAPPNHAMDCDDSLGYEFPFVLKAVNKDGTACAWCPWYRFCRGCLIQCCDTKFNFSSNYIAIDWDPTALHLRYQTAQEKVCEEHVSVSLIMQQQLEPINLDYCLEAFTKEEQLGEEEKYFCSKCNEHQLASKKLEIWRLPPILILHLKRFQNVNGMWVKSQTVVQFPFDDFELTEYLASIPRETVLRHKAKLANEKSKADPTEANNNNLPPDPDEDPLNDFHQHLLNENADPFDLRYNLYGIVSHSGMLGGGHYISYANNLNGRWYCYNDSSCKETSDVDAGSAYMLFYERQGVCETRYMPDVTGQEEPADTRDVDEEFYSDLRKLCTLM